MASQIAVGYSGTSDFNILQKASVNTNFSLLETKGDIENLRKLLKSNTPLAVVQEDILQDLVRQDPQLKDRLKIVSPLYRAAIVLIVPKESPIQTFKDLASKRVIVDVVGSGDYYTFLKLLEKSLINPEIFNIKKNEALKFLRLKKADAYFFIGDIKEVATLQPAYRLIPVTSFENRYQTFKLDEKNSLTTAYVIKYLVTEKSKEDRYSKQDLHILLSNLLDVSDRDFLCSFNALTPVNKEDFIYFACSEHVNKKSVKKIVPSNKRKIKAALYYDNLEDITIYPEALRDKNFDNYGTTYIMEKVKFDNAVKLIKKELGSEEETKIVIISHGPQGRAMSNANFIYRKLKKAKIPRDSLIKKVIPSSCSGDECFYKTTITFKVL